MFLKIIKISTILCIFAYPIFAHQFAEYDHEESLSRQKRVILFPQFTTLQLSMALVAQVSHITSHKFAVNTGFQINYGLPFNLATIIKTAYWGRSSSNTTSPFTSFFNRLIESNDDFSLGFSSNSSQIETSSQIIYAKSEENIETTEYSEDNEITTTEHSTTTTKKLKKKRKSKMKRDISAAEFYAGIKDTMNFAGYHDDCLLKSICEFAKHPLADHNHDILHEVLHFILTPSVHQAFDTETEEPERKLYEEAEEIGKFDGDCELMYGECEISPLHKMSNFITEDDLE